MKIILFLVLIFILSTGSFSQPATIFTVGFTTASERSIGLEEFATTSQLALNNNSFIKVSQARKGFNFGLGFHSPKQEEFMAPYARMLLNYSHQGGNAIKIDALTLRASTNVLDITAAGGIMNKKGGAFYAIIGPSFYKSKFDFSGNSLLTGKYSASIAKLSYGIGAGFFGSSGSGIYFDALFNFRSLHGKKYYENSGNKRIPEDYDSYSKNSTSYSGEYVSNALSYFRLQISAVIGLGKK